MFKKSDAIYFNQHPSFYKGDQGEEKKISYWLEKLHTQQEKQNSKDYQKERKAESDRSPPYRETEKTLEEKGRNEYTTRHAIKDEKDKQIVNDLVKKSNRCVISISSLFPWNIFPNTITVEESRVTFIFRQLFASQSHSVDIKDISNVFIESSFFFANLQVVSRTFIQNDIKIGYLNKLKANKVQRIIEGLRIFEGNGINTSNYNIEDLIAKTEAFHTNSTS